MTTSQPVRAVVRAINLLKALNRQPISTLDALYTATGIPKSSIVRLLRTLESQGLVRHAPQHGAYYLTSAVKLLSSGYHSEPKIVEAAAEPMDALTLRIKWPLAIAVPADHAVYVRYSTIPISPLSFLHSSLDMRLSLVSRALGRAYLAFCDDDERDVNLKALQNSPEPEDAPARNPEAVLRMLDLVRARGYATRDPQVRPISGTLAVPVMADGRVVATVGMTYFSSVLNDITAVENHLEDLQQLSKEISARLQVLEQPDAPAQQLPAIFSEPVAEAMDC